MPVSDIRLTRSRKDAGELVVRLGVPLLDGYLEFLAGRCRPNTVLAVAYDLKVFFTVAGKPARRVRPVDVLAFMTAQRAGGESRLQVAGAGAGGVSARTLRRRLSSVSGLYGFLQARGDVNANPVPRGLPTRRVTRSDEKPRSRGRAEHCADRLDLGAGRRLDGKQSPVPSRPASADRLEQVADDVVADLAPEAGALFVGIEEVEADQHARQIDVLD